MEMELRRGAHRYHYCAGLLFCSRYKGKLFIHQSEYLCAFIFRSNKTIYDYLAVFLIELPFHSLALRKNLGLICSALSRICSALWRRLFAPTVPIVILDHRTRWELTFYTKLANSINFCLLFDLFLARLVCDLHHLSFEPRKPQHASKKRGIVLVLRWRKSDSRLSDQRQLGQTEEARCTSLPK